MRRVYRTERYSFDGTLPGYPHGDPIRIVNHRQGNPGARALASLAWGDDVDAYTIHTYVDRDGVAIDGLEPTTHAYHVREHRKAAELGFPVRQHRRPWLRKRGDVRAIGIETVDLGTADDYHLSQETRITLLLRNAAYIRLFPEISPLGHVHEHGDLDPWTRSHDMGDALNMVDFRLDLIDLLSGDEEPWRTVQEIATGARAPAEWKRGGATSGDAALAAVRRAQEQLDEAAQRLAGRA